MCEFALSVGIHELAWQTLGIVVTDVSAPLAGRLTCPFACTLPRSVARTRSSTAAWSSARGVPRMRELTLVPVAAFAFLVEVAYLVSATRRVSRTCFRGGSGPTLGAGLRATALSPGLPFPTSFAAASAASSLDACGALCCAFSSGQHRIHLFAPLVAD